MSKNNTPVIFTEPVKKVEAELVDEHLFISMTKPVNRLAELTDYVCSFTVSFKEGEASELTPEKLKELFPERKRAKAKP